MAKYSSQPVVIEQAASVLAEKFSDFSRLETAMNNLSDSERAKVGDVSFTSDSIKLKTPQVGDITLQVTERGANGVKLTAVGSPVPMGLEINFKAVSETSTEVTGVIEVEIPAMLRPIIGGTMQKAADQFGQMFARLA